MSTIVWIHGDCLSPTNPALRANPDAPAIFVWDDALLQSYRLSFKRILFMYECLLEMPVVIRRGDVATELQRYAAEIGAATIATTETPAPRFHAIATQLSKSGYKVQVYKLPAFIELNRRPDLNRFSRYWREARSVAFQPTNSRGV